MVIVFNATFNNISVIVAVLYISVLLGMRPTERVDIFY